MRRAARRDANEATIVRGLEAIGCTVTKLNEPGVTDLLVGFGGVNYCVEIKDPDKPPSARTLTPAQVKWHAEWRGQNAVAETLDEAVGIVTGVMPCCLGLLLQHRPGCRFG